MIVRLRSLARLVAQQADLIIPFGDPAIRAAQRATQTIPIVGMTDDMVGSGLAASLARPGGNTTGVSILASELDVKRLEILHEYVPQARRIAALADPTTISTRTRLASAARDLGLELVWFEAQSPDETSRALAAIAAEAVNVLASPILNSFRRLTIDQMRDARLPTSGPKPWRKGGFWAMGREICSVTGISSASLTRFCAVPSRPICRSSSPPNSSWS